MSYRPSSVKNNLRGQYISQLKVLKPNLFLVDSEEIFERAGKRLLEAHKMGTLPSLPSKVSWAIAVFFIGTKQLNL